MQALLEKLKELEREHPQAMQSPMMLTGSHAAELAGSKCLLQMADTGMQRYDCSSM